jgi:dimethylargininase
MFRHALVRPPGATFAAGLTRAGLGAPDLALARAQHARYCAALERCGLAVTRLAPDDAHPDAPFVEDCAVLVPGLAVVTRPGAESRRGEVAAIRAAIGDRFAEVREIAAPGTLDGGDVCAAGGAFFVGVSARTNEDGARQLAEFLSRRLYAVTLVDIRGVPGLLHLKSGLADLGDGRLAAVAALAERDLFAGYEVVRVEPDEEYAANCVRVNDHVLVAAGCPRLAAALGALGYATIALEMSEFRKQDGGLSCLSLRH